MEIVVNRENTSTLFDKKHFKKTVKNSEGRRHKISIAVIYPTAVRRSNFRFFLPKKNNQWSVFMLARENGYAFDVS